MKRILIGWLMTVVLSVASSTLQAADVTITVNGQVVAAPCIVNTTNTTVNLGNLSTMSLVSAGSASTWQNVELNLTNCPDGTSTVTATFSGTTDSTGYYKNEGTANNIQIELQDNSGNPLNNGASKSILVDSGRSASFALQVRALTVSGGATQGTIQAVITVTYTYA